MDAAVNYNISLSLFLVQLSDCIS